MVYQAAYSAPAPKTADYRRLRQKTALCLILLQAITDYRRVPETTAYNWPIPTTDYLYCGLLPNNSHCGTNCRLRMLPQTITDCRSLSHATSDYRILALITADYRGPPKTATDYRRLLQTTEDYHRLLETTAHQSALL